jgi:mRNA-degrading endonuclease RelE of RelBE toxin-antitoxin system
VKRFIWEESAKEELRRIEQRQALDILRALTRLANGEDIGKIKKLTGDPHDRYRFRFGDEFSLVTKNRKHFAMIAGLHLRVPSN